jgi:hypothetical protein
MDRDLTAATRRESEARRRLEVKRARLQALPAALAPGSR